jgi:hypothetical protein
MASALFAWGQQAVANRPQDAILPRTVSARGTCYVEAMSLQPNRAKFVQALIPIAAAAQTLSLQSADGLTLRRVKAEPVTYKGRKAIKITSDGSENGFAIVAGRIFRRNHRSRSRRRTGSGRSIAGARIRRRGVPHGARCVQVRMDLPATHQWRADDQERRNHSTQYDSFPHYPWSRLRKETRENTKAMWTWFPASGPK